MHNKTNFSGFTLIELLVVISIISLLSSIALASLSSAREKAYNSYVTQTIKQYLLALELYKNQNKTYPIIADMDWHCLGDGYPGGICMYIDESPATEIPALNNAIRPFIKPIALTKRHTLAGTCSDEDILIGNCFPGDPSAFAGIVYICAETQNNVCTKNAIIWGLSGTAQCNIDGSSRLFSVPDTACFFSPTVTYGI